MTGPLRPAPRTSCGTCAWSGGPLSTSGSLNFRRRVSSDPATGRSGRAVRRAAKGCRGDEARAPREGIARPWFIERRARCRTGLRGRRLCGLSVSAEDKSPYTATGFKAATSSADQIKAWWRTCPEAAIGIPTGEVSGLVVADVDTRNGGDIHAICPRYDDLAGPSARAPSGGRHYYFRHPGVPVRCRASKLSQGIDIRADGGYVIAPPSINGAGGWEWEDQSDLLTCPLLDLPSWAIVKEPAAAKGNGAAHHSTKITEGARNSRLASLGGSMARRGMSPAAIEAALLAENAARYDPALDEDEVRRIAVSMARYRPARTYEDPPIEDYTEDAARSGASAAPQWKAHEETGDSGASGAGARATQIILRARRSHPDRRQRHQGAA